ncbi:Rnf-Nqr domain containing protein [Candidatus Similichlamydia laticola]|uniref:Na(+)-translocating NADH-quinone reductase subunit D n=1 Tax=Candidatus Similichlamydia laticola TaxID=2170265 RepID=A0A369KHU5_9BACT|nr:Rnf-Nqr domain containing protein [Candidatus Similichlamydia laticola]RDB31363.1 Na(+)-translocating NADH-quinone reductase subunit D [Candidatus Similichlamydia laticola]
MNTEQSVSRRGRLISYRLRKFFFEDHQIFVANLGICSALGVTNQVSNALIMTIGVCFITCMSTCFVSVLRKQIPDTTRLVLQMIIICTFCIITEQLLKSFLYKKYKTLAIYINLIATNCIVLGRCESYAMYHPPLKAMRDGLRAGLQYGFTLITVAFFRELLGNGSILGLSLFPERWYANSLNPNLLQNVGIFLLPSGAFFVLAVIMMFFKRPAK